MDLKKFYFDNIKDSDYHIKFKENIKSVNCVYSIFSGEEEIFDYQFEVFDEEEAIVKFKELCQPEVTFDNEKCCWFYLITYFLDKVGYEIKEFPRILARPPVEPGEFTYGDIRTRLIALGEDNNGTVRYATRRKYVSNFTFAKKQNQIELDEFLEQKFIKISNRQAAFNSMSTDEKITEIANLIENLLKKEGKFIVPEYHKICFEYISNENIVIYRKQIQCFRHASDESLVERKNYTDSQKQFFIDYGIILLKVIHELTN